MPVFAIGQYHPGDEGAKRRREADQAHQRGNTDYQRQRRRRVHLAQVRAGDVAEKRAGEEVGAADDSADDRDNQRRFLPGGHAVEQGRRFMTLCVSSQPRQGKHWQ